jgi:hypothetical protein
MAFRSLIIGRVHIVRWKKPELPDVPIIIRELREGSERLGTKLIGVSVVPPNAEAPDDKVRSAMSKNMAELLKCTDTLHFVMEGSGFRHSAMRSILSGVVILQGERGRILVHNTFEAALRQFEHRLQMPRDEFLKRVKASRILDDL